MYMRVRHVRHDPAKLDEGIALSLEVHAALRQRPGFQSGMIALDRTTGEAFAVSTWDTEEHAGFPGGAVDLAGRDEAAGLQVDPPQVFEIIAS